MQIFCGKIVGKLVPSFGKKRRDGYFNVSKGGGSLRERGLIFIEEAPGGGKFSPSSFHEIHPFFHSD